TRKRMSVIAEDGNGDRYLIVKGAPEILLPRCTSTIDLHGTNSQLQRDKIEAKMDEMAQKALRIIAVSVKKLPKYENVNITDTAMLENDLTFIGLYGLQDPPRKNVKKAIMQCKEAGIKTVMITGDHKKTAMAIGKEVGLFEHNDLVLDGSELNEMSTNELANIINRVAIFARVTPEHKLKIVKAFQEKGHIVAMTGDGVNDAPAIKASNVGISMG